jgi:putative ABC transport system substrate-binding protein
MPTTQSIAKDFVSKKEDIIFAVATPSAQAAFNATKEIPILITAVTDPVDAGLVKSIEKPGTNVTGTSDIVPIEDQLQLLKKIMPKAKKVGILFNTSENNSQIQVQNIKNAAPKFELEVMESSITNVNEVPQALNSLLEKVDVLYTPTDNTVASAMTMISNECFKKNIPIIGAERAHVTGGALATIGIDYYKLGFQTGLLAVDIINGKKPSEMPIETLEQMQLVINEDSVKKLNLNIPKELIEKAEMVKKGDK